MSDKKHIDRLFQEKFKDFEAKPSANVWAGIQSNMEQPQEKTKTVFPIWLRFASIAAALVLLFTVGNLVFNNVTTNANNTKIVDTNTTESENTNITSSNSEGIITNSNTSTENTNNLKDNNSISSEKELLNNTTVVTTDKDSKSNIISETTKTKANNLSSQLENTKSVSKENNGTGNRFVTSQNNSNNTNGVSTNSENGNYLNSTGNSRRLTQNTSVDNKNNSVSNSTYPDNAIANNTSNTSNTSEPNNSNNSTADNTNSTSNKLNTKAINAIDNNNATSNTAVATTDSEKEKEEEKMMEPDSANSSNAIEEALAKNVEDLDEKEEENVDRWSVNANAAPVYYNTLGKGSHIHDQFIDNPKNGEVNTSYGVNVGYALNDKLKVRSGINKLNLSYDTANVIVYETVTNNPGSSPLRNINFVPTNEGQNISVLSANSLSVQQIDGFINDDLNAALSQRLSYFEVPLELEYAVVNKRFGVNLIGGFSTFILGDNEVVTEVDNRKTKIGEANNINNISFSANAGIGIDYKFNKSLKFNLEPTFKYQINAYNETSGDFRPYIIGVYTGFSYKF